MGNAALLCVNDKSSAWLEMKGFYVKFLLSFNSSVNHCITQILLKYVALSGHALAYPGQS